jgi:hypothetical protein
MNLSESEPSREQFWHAIQDLEDFYEKTKDLENTELTAPNGKVMSWLQKIQWTSNTEIRLWARLEKLAYDASHGDEIAAEKAMREAMEQLFARRIKQFEDRNARRKDNTKGNKE